MEEGHPRRPVWVRRTLALCLLAVAAGAPYLAGLGHDFPVEAAGDLLVALVATFSRQSKHRGKTSGQGRRRRAADSRP